MRQSRLSYFADFVITSVLLAWLIGWEFETRRSALHLFLWLNGAVAGVLLWTLIEYLVHRILFHHVGYFERLHDAHHDHPTDYIGAPPGIGPLALLGLAYLFSARAMGGELTGALASGLLIGYLIYMLVHHAVHHWSVPTTTVLFGARRHHALHHYHSDTGNFGVTTALWDHAFGTALPSSRHSRNAPLPADEGDKGLRSEDGI